MSEWYPQAYEENQDSLVKETEKKKNHWINGGDNWQNIIGAWHRLMFFLCLSDVLLSQDNG